MGTGQPFDEQTFDQQSWIAQRAKYEYGLLKQECDTLHYSQPQAYEPCLEKAKSTRENLLTQAQGSQQAGQGSQGSASNQSGQSGQKQGPIEKVTSVVKEKLVDWGLASPDQGQPSAGQQGQGSQQGSSQARNPLQASFDAGQGTQGQQSFGAGSRQGGQNVGQQGLTQGQQFQGQQGQSGQGSFQGGNYGQQPQGQSGSERSSSSRAEGRRVKVQQKLEITLPKARRARPANKQRQRADRPEGKRSTWIVSNITKNLRVGSTRR